MQELGQISLSPFGSRALSAGVLKINALVRDCAPGTPAQKWKVFRDISAARTSLGVPDRALIVLNALLSFHPDAVLTAGSADLVVFPSNRHLSLRSHGMAASTLRRHLAALVDHGLILRRSRVMNDYRVELIGFTDAMVPRLRALGLISEIISWKLRLFIPTAAQGSAILASLLDRHTLVGLTDRTVAA